MKKTKLFGLIFSHTVDKSGAFLFTVFCCNALELLYGVSVSGKFTQDGRKVYQDVFAQQINKLI
jgi:hypothetical protein